MGSLPVGFKELEVAYWKQLASAQRDRLRSGRQAIMASDQSSKLWQSWSELPFNGEANGLSSTTSTDEHVSHANVQKGTHDCQRG